MQWTLQSRDYPVYRTPGSLKFEYLRAKIIKTRDGPRTSLKGPGGAVWRKEPDKTKSRETVPLNTCNKHFAY